MRYLPVGNGHELYIERVGNLEGPTVLFLHGGPGGGCGEGDKDFFDFEKQNVIFFDQRGAGKSKFEGDVLENNTTDDLVGDINKILDYFKINDAVYLFGGSWGSTLALVFAIRYPSRVKGMVLRGIWLPSEPRIDFLFGNEKPYLFPDYWEKILDKVPMRNRDNVCQFFLDKMCGTTGEEQWRWAYDFAFFEGLLAFLDPDVSAIKRNLKTDKKLVDSAKIEAYYAANRCFLEGDYILDNADKITNIPTRIIHGRYDAICPAYDAWELHQKLPKSTIQFPLAGHSTRDLPLKKALIEVVKPFVK